jgi:hypothetical protein
MIPRVLEVKAIGDYTLWVRFSDGKSGTVDLSAELWGPMFEPLRDRTLFARASVHPELHTVTWPNGADLSPEYLYQAAQPPVAADAPQASRR